MTLSTITFDMNRLQDLRHLTGGMRHRVKAVIWACGDYKQYRRYCLATVIWEFFTMKYPSCLTLLLLNTTCSVLANSVDPDQLASSEAN